jgi:CRISPR system Cascade subunit CasB
MPAVYCKADRVVGIPPESSEVQEMSDVQSKAKAFVSFILSRKEDRGFLARLRKAQSKTTEHEAYEILAPWIDLESRKMREIYGTVGSLLSMHKKSSSNGKGVGFSLLAASGFDRESPAPRARLRRLLACDDVIEVLPHVKASLKLAASKDASIDYSQVLSDLVWFGDRVKARWAKEYYSRTKED